MPPWRITLLDACRCGNFSRLAGLAPAKEEKMSSRQMIVYFFGGSTAIIFFMSIAYWSVNFFIKQCTDRVFLQFKQHLARETDRAIRLFKENLCEQIVQQENRSDSVAKLYSLLIDLMRAGKEFSGSMARGDLQQAEKMLRGIRNSGESFNDLLQKQRLHFPDDFCAVLAKFVTEQKALVEELEGNWYLVRRVAAEGGISSHAAEMKQRWIGFEDRITQLMDAMRNEFRKRPSAAAVMSTWLNEPAAPKGATAPSQDAS
jgi:hypothetical protein